MSTVRILHVDDEPDIREVAGMSLGLKADFEVRACGSGPEAIAAASEWKPSLILLDVMMPGMDGPATLKELRANPVTSDVPVIFVTARAQSREVEHLVSLGAQGVISKPFDPMKLASQVGEFLHSIGMDKMRKAFRDRAKNDAVRLAELQSLLGGEPRAGDLTRIKEIAHSLAGVAGMYGFDKISRDASTLEDAADATLGNGGPTEVVTDALEGLLFDLETTVRDPAPAYA